MADAAEVGSSRAQRWIDDAAERTDDVGADEATSEGESQADAGDGEPGEGDEEAGAEA